MKKFARTYQMLRALAALALFAFLVLSDGEFCTFGRRTFWNVQAFSIPVSKALIRENRRPSVEGTVGISHFIDRSLVVLYGSINNDPDGGNGEERKIRLNKVFKRTHSRREADRLIEEGRVSVNGERVNTKGGFFVVPYVDEVSLDGKVVEGWEEMNFVVDNAYSIKKPKSVKNDTSTRSSNINQAKKSNRKATTAAAAKRQSTFEYIKYWKPRGVICTTDPKIPHNIVEELEIDGYHPPHRVYPVGRLDKDTSGIILVTSDGRLPNAALRKEHKRSKVYEVGLDRPISDPTRVLGELRTGVIISTETVRNGVRKTLTAPTEPCQVEQLTDRWLRITLKEGRNRQVRKMTQAVGYKTVELERVAFAGILLEPGLRGPGDWDYLRGRELEIVTEMIEAAKASAAAEAAAAVPEPDEEWSSGW